MKIFFIFFVFISFNLNAQLPAPIAYYPLNGNANDASGNGLNGTINGAVPTLDRCGNANSAFLFNGINSSITINFNTLFDIPPNGQFTISSWIRPINSNVNAVFVKCFFANPWTNGIWDYGQYLINSQAMSGAGSPGWVLLSNSNVQNQQCWTHFVFTYNNGIWKMYLNGVLVDQDLTQSSFITQSTGGLAIGKKGDSNGDFFNGSIDDVAFYNVEFTGTQVLALFDSQKTTIQPVTSNLTICPGDSVQLNLTSSCSTLQASSILWTPGGTLNSNNIINPFASPTANTTYQSSLTIQQCVFQNSINVSVTNLNVNLGPDLTLCTNTPTQLNAQNPGASYLWQDGTTNQTFDVFLTGSYWVDVTLNGCTSRDSITINFLPNPLLNLGNDTTLCDGDTLILDAGIIGYSSLWQDGSANPIFTVVNPGTYWVDISQSGCIYNDTISINYISINVNLGNDLIICPQDIAVLNASNNGGSFLWQDGSTAQTFNATQSGIYWVEVSTQNCSNSDTVLVNINEISADFVALNSSGCEPLEVDFSNLCTTNLGTLSFFWDFGDGFTSTALNPTHTYNSPGMYNVSLISTGSSGCFDDTVALNLITVHPEPIANFLIQPSGHLRPNEQITFTNSSTNDDSWFWDFGDNTTSTNENPVHLYSDVGNYAVYLVASNQFGCVDSAILQLEVVEDFGIYIPNTFTPDQDEFNQTWKYYFQGIETTNFSIEIYDRWGENIWQSYSPFEFWDGTYDGKIAPNGLYTWKVQCSSKQENKEQLFYGHVHILR